VVSLIILYNNRTGALLNKLLNKNEKKWPGWDSGPGECG
jgi:hypothetical protein